MLDERAKRSRFSTYSSRSTAGVDLAAQSVVLGPDQLVGAQDQAFELVLDDVVELHAALVDDLEPVVARWVVRRGDHHAGTEWTDAGQVRQRGRGTDTEPMNVDAERHRARRDCGREHVA